MTSMRHEAGRHPGRRSRLVLLGGVLLLLAIAVAGRQLHRRGLEVVQVEPVRRTALQSSVLASGELVFKDRVELKPQVIGRVLETLVEEGERVSAGQVVVRLDPQVYEAQVKRQEAIARQQAAAIESQRIIIAGMAREWERKEAFARDRLIDASTFDSATTQLQLAKVELRSRQDALQAMQAELDQAREDLQRTIIRSPIGGVVTSLSVRPGETVVAGTNIPGSTMLEIADPAETLAEVQVDEADINNVRAGAGARIEADSVPGMSFHGKVVSIAPSVSQDGRQMGRRFLVHISLDDAPPGTIRPGMSCRAEIVAASRDAAIVVPMVAVLHERGADATDASLDSNPDGDGAPYVMRVRGGIAAKVPIVAGISSDSAMEVLRGVVPGDRIVVGPFVTLHHLADGAAVEADRGAAATSDGSP